MEVSLNKIINKINTPKKIMAVIIAVVAAVIGITLAISFANRNKINIKGYINIEYKGADKYATAMCHVDTDKLYKAMAGNVRDMEKLSEYRELAESVTALVNDKDISNGQNITVNVSFDEDKAQKAGIQFNDTSYIVKASGISTGKVISLFENVEVVFAGMSPEAYVKVTNKWDDEYLGSIEFKSDKNSQIALGDVIRITCSATDEELGQHGYIASQLYLDYKVDKLNSYAQITDIDKNVINSLSTEAMSVITQQVDDTTFRMMYKASQDTAYLRDVNDENVTSIEPVGTYFLKRKNVSEGTVDNYIYMVFAADVVSSSNQMKIYFTFEYSQGYVSTDGSFDIMHDKPENRYQCSNNMESLYNSVIGSKGELYTITAIQ